MTTMDNDKIHNEKYYPASDINKKDIETLFENYKSKNLTFINVFKLRSLTVQVCHPHCDYNCRNFCRDPFLNEDDDDDDENFEGRSKQFRYETKFGFEFSHTSGSDPETNYVPFSEDRRGWRNLSFSRRNKNKDINLKRTVNNLYTTTSTQTKPKMAKVYNKETNGISTNRTDYKSKSFNALRQCFCTLKFSKYAMGRKVDACSSESVRLKHRSNSVHRRENSKCVPGICTSYECLPEKCNEIAKKKYSKQNQYKRHNRNNRMRTVKSIQTYQELCTCVTSLPVDHYKQIQSFDIQKSKNLKTRNKSATMKSVSNGINVVKRCLCTLKFYEEGLNQTKVKTSKSAHMEKRTPLSMPKIKKSLSESSLDKKKNEDKKAYANKKNTKVINETDRDTYKRKHKTKRQHRQLSECQPRCYDSDTRKHRRKEVTEDLEEGECEPGLCIPYECDVDECLSEIQRRELCLKKRRRRRKRRCISDLEEGECPVGICQPSVCEPYDCLREIQMQEECLDKKTKSKHKRICKEDLDENECERGICEPEKCDPIECFKVIQKREPCSDTFVRKSKRKKSAITKVSKSPKPSRPLKPPKEPKPSKPPKPPKEPRPSKPPKPPKEPRPSKPPKPPKVPKPPKPPEPIIVKCKCIPKVKKVVSQDSFEEVIVRKKKKKGKKRVHNVTVYNTATELFRDKNTSKSSCKNNLQDYLKYYSKSSSTSSQAKTLGKREHYEKAWFDRKYIKLHIVQGNHKLSESGYISLVERYLKLLTRQLKPRLIDAEKETEFNDIIIIMGCHLHCRLVQDWTKRQYHEMKRLSQDPREYLLMLTSKLQ